MQYLKNGIDSIGLHLMLLCFLYPFSCDLKWGSHNSHFPSTQESWCDGDIAKVRAGYLPFPCCRMKESWAWDTLLLIPDSLVIPGQEPPSMRGLGILCQRQELSGVEFRKDQEEIITCMSGNCIRRSSSVLKNSNICPLKDPAVKTCFPLYIYIYIYIYI